MYSKLTLRIENDLIQLAKKYASKNNKSVSKIVADYFAVIADKTTDTKIQKAPVTNSLIGILANKKVNEKDFRKHLEDKYL